MDSETVDVLDRVATWPQEDREELAEIAASIEARRSGVYHVTDDERAAIEEGLRDAETGRFVPESEMNTFWARFDRK